MPMILRWQLTWNASSCFASRMVLVSEPYILSSACRMAQVSKPCRHTDLTKHAYETLINSECLRQGETHLVPYTTEIAHCWSCQSDQMYCVSFAISMRHLFWLKIGAHVKSVIPPTIFPSTLKEHQVSRFWILVFCHATFIPNVLRFHGNLIVLLTTDHQVPCAVVAPIFSILDNTRFTLWIACWRSSANAI